MTSKEYCIIKQFIQALVDVAYERCTIRIEGKNCGCITINDANDLLKRISLLVEDKDDDEN